MKYDKIYHLELSIGNKKSRYSKKDIYSDIFLNKEDAIDFGKKWFKEKAIYYLGSNASNDEIEKFFEKSMCYSFTIMIYNTDRYNDYKGMRFVSELLKCIINDSSIEKTHHYDEMLRYAIFERQEYHYNGMYSYGDMCFNSTEIREDIDELSEEEFKDSPHIFKLGDIIKNKETSIIYHVISIPQSIYDESVNFRCLRRSYELIRYNLPYEFFKNAHEKTKRGEYDYDLGNEDELSNNILNKERYEVIGNEPVSKYVYREYWEDK